MKSITVRTPSSDEVLHIRNVVRAGLNEHWFRAYYNGIFLSVPIQVVTLVCVLFILTFVEKLRFQDILIFIICAHLALAGLAKQYWRIIINKATMELEDKQKFHEMYLKQSESNFWVAELKHEGRPTILVGTVGVRLPKIEHVFKNKESICCTSLELTRMSIAKSCRGTGVANILLSKVLQHARKHEKHVVLHTTGAQPAAMRFYSKNGFQRIVERKEIALSGAISLPTYYFIKLFKE
ncbi:N-acetyltransferase 8-like [Ciona intestinalis]